MDKIAKALARLTEKERAAFRALLLLIAKGQLAGLDVVKLKNRGDIYRVRKGSYRVIFKRNKDGKHFILSLERRNDTTYN